MKLLQGDCLEHMATLEPHSIDAIIADLPYGTTYAKWDSIIPLEKLWEHYNRLIKKNGVVLLFGSQPFTSLLINSNIKRFKYCWYWAKERGTGFLNAKHQPLRVIEEICVFYRKLNTYCPQMIALEKPYYHALPNVQCDLNHTGLKTITDPNKRVYKLFTHTFPKNILEFSRDYKPYLPTQKPLALLEYFIQTYTNPGDLVLDNVMGSGTTGLACKNKGRDFIGIELNPDHYEHARQRLSH